jgi:hypothetical protein
MKNLLRTSGVVAVLAFTVLTAGSATQYAACQTSCADFSAHRFTQVTTHPTESQCCSGTYNPCPAGSVARSIPIDANGNLTYCEE